MKYAFVDYRISNEELTSLEKLKISPIIVPKCCDLYEAIDGHPDIQLNILNSKQIIVHKNISLKFIDKLNDLHIKIIYSENILTSKYPWDIMLNAVNLDNLFLHNLKYTDKNLLKLVAHKTLINTKQGYTKCSTAVVSNNALITSDKSIVTSFKNYSIDLLYVPYGDIVLPGLNYGFIGGCCGLISSNKMAFFGNLNCYEYGTKVINFLEKHNVEPVYLKEGKLIDRGSLMCIDL